MAMSGISESFVPQPRRCLAKNFLVGKFVDHKIILRQRPPFTRDQSRNILSNKVSALEGSFDEPDAISQAIPTSGTADGPEDEVMKPLATGLVVAATAEGTELTELSQGFYNRTRELHELHNLLNNAPGSVLLVTGPPNTGKSKVLAELKAQRASSPYLYINCRLAEITGPVEIAEALCQGLTKDDGDFLRKCGDFGQRVLAALASGVKGEIALGQKDIMGGKLVLNFSEMLSGKNLDLMNVLDNLKILLESSNELEIKPAIIIDEANQLMHWKEDDERDIMLDKLLNFFVSITKELELAHVVLATSDSFFLSWLDGKGLKAFQSKTRVIGDLNEKEAYGYLFGDKNKNWDGLVNDPRLRDVPAGGEKVWEDIFKVCGGNIGLLRELVIEATAPSNDGWKGALESILSQARAAVDSGFDPDYLKEQKRTNPPGWTEAQYEVALQEIATGQTVNGVRYHAVPEKALVAKLRQLGSGRRALNSMIEYNLLTLRPPSQLAQDIDVAVYGEQRRRVVTMPTPAYLYCVLEIYGTEE